MNQSFMSLSKNSSKVLLALFLIISNFWIYKILNENLIVGALLIVISMIIVLKPKQINLLVLCVLILLFFQFQTTHVKDLALLDNDEQRVQQERMRSYPLTYISIFSKALWLKPEIWIEQNNLVIALSRIEKNFFSSLDINQYFFGGFPRNNPSDFQKFIFITLPFFIAGIFALLKKKQYAVLSLIFLVPVIVLSFIGNDNQLGPFVLFPFFIISIFLGIELFLEKLQK